MSEKLKKLERDLSNLANHWHQLVKDHKLLNDKEFLSCIAKDVTELENDLEDTESLHPLGDSVELIHYLINTTWGAPFVFNTPLLEAAQRFKPETYRDSSLRALMGEFVEFHDELEEQLFNCLEEVKAQIRNIEPS